MSHVPIFIIILKHVTIYIVYSTIQPIVFQTVFIKRKTFPLFFKLNILCASSVLWYLHMKHVQYYTNIETCCVYSNITHNNYNFNNYNYYSMSSCKYPMSLLGWLYFITIIQRLRANSGWHFWVKIIIIVKINNIIQIRLAYRRKYRYISTWLYHTCANTIKISILKNTNRKRNTWPAYRPINIEKSNQSAHNILI